MTSEYMIHAKFDNEARTWIATSDDVPGLCAEAATFEELVEIVVGLVPELLLANDKLAMSEKNGGIPIHIMAERQAIAHITY